MKRNCALRSMSYGAAMKIIAVPLLMLFTSAQQEVSAEPRAGRIDRITPAAARSGERVTVEGIGFGGPNVTIHVGGVSALVVAATGHQATFVVPRNLAPGFQVVDATNPGTHSGSIGFRVLEGVLLQGSPSSPAIDAVFDVAPVRADPGQIDRHLILTRLELRFAADSTVGQVNAALRAVEGGIVSMSRGLPVVAIAVPRPPSVAVLEALADALSVAPGISWAFLAHEPAEQVVPASSSSTSDQQLLPIRFPAAWNAMQLALQDCATRKVPVLVADNFIRPTPPSHIGFAVQIPNFLPSPPDESGDDTHGYDVTTTLAALFDDHSLTGANPFSQCLDITAVQVGGLGNFQAIDRIVRNFPSQGPFILNFSIGFNYDCVPETLPNGEQRCTPASIAQSIPTAYARANLGGYWKLRTLDRWDDFFAAASAGNNRDELGARIYPGLGVARYNSALTTAEESDPLFGFIQDTRLWKSTLADAALPDLTATSDQVARLRADLVHDGLDQVGASTNSLVVGSTKQGATFADLRLSAFSGSQADVAAVGENIATFSPGTAVAGTSFSTPQVAGLASYLWLLSNDLRSEPASVTREAIVENARLVALAGPVVDAYATVLSLDAEELPTPASAPVRLAILDVNNDGRFDESDIATFLAHFLDGQGNPVEPATADYSRFDLNGDGFTGGSRTESFDLDRIGSTQFGATKYSSAVSQQIEGQAISFDANALTDMEILCYYAYSALYTGDTAARAQLVGGCAGVRVRVTPGGVALTPGQSQQFTAQVTGAQDVMVTWAIDGVNGGNSNVGTVSDAGLYTAPSTGTHTVRATSVADPRGFGEATVTVRAAGSVRVVRTSAFGHAVACASAPGGRGSCDPEDSTVDTPALTLHAFATIAPATDGASSASADLDVDSHFELDPVSGSLTSVSGSADATVSATIVNLTLDSGHEASATAMGGMFLDFEITSGSFTFVLSGTPGGDGFAFAGLLDAVAFPAQQIVQLDANGTPVTGVLPPGRYRVLVNLDTGAGAGSRNLFDTDSESASYDFTFTLAPAP